MSAGEFLAGRGAPRESLDGEYSVFVWRGGERVFEFQGYADNPSDALEKAIEARQETVWARPTAPKMTVVPEGVHVREGGWCSQCGGTGELETPHVDISA